MKKPTITAIRSVQPLSKLPRRPTDLLSACNVCGRASPSPDLGVWLEHDEKDQPRLPLEPDALIFVDRNHGACLDLLEKHPRLYVESRGAPGFFPHLCGPCTRREGVRCTHPDTKANGGPGLQIEVANFGIRGLVCAKGAAPAPRVLTCAGQTITSPASSTDGGEGENKENHP